jgi:hypothetical protein
MASGYVDWDSHVMENVDELARSFIEFDIQQINFEKLIHRECGQSSYETFDQRIEPFRFVNE